MYFLTRGAQDLQPQIAQFPPTKMERLIRRQDIRIVSTEYFPHERKALVRVRVSQLTGENNTFLTLREYWMSVQRVLGSEQSLGQKAKALLGFAYALNVFYEHVLSEVQHRQLRKPHTSVCRGLQQLLGLACERARGDEHYGELKYEIRPGKQYESLNTAALEDRLFLDDLAVLRLRQYLFDEHSVREGKTFAYTLDWLDFL